MTRWVIAILYGLCVLTLTPSAWCEPDIDPDVEPSDEIKQALEEQKQRCLEAYQGADIGVLTLDSLCELRAWALLGEQYPKQAQAAEQAQGEADRFAARLNECRDTLTRQQEYGDRCSAKLGNLQRRPTKLQAAGWGMGSFAVGAAVGVLVVVFAGSG